MGISPKADRVLRVYALVITLIALAKIMETLPSSLPSIPPTDWHLADIGNATVAEGLNASTTPFKEQFEGNASTGAQPSVQHSEPRSAAASTTRRTQAPAPLGSVEHRIQDAFVLGNNEGEGRHRVAQPYGSERRLAGLFRGHRPVGLGIDVVYDDKVLSDGGGGTAELNCSTTAATPSRNNPGNGSCSSTNVSSAANLKAVAARPPINGSPRPAIRIAVCFFGLVKNVSSRQIEHFRRNLLQPLERYLGIEGGGDGSAAGSGIDVFLHTFNFSNHRFSNPRNGEENAAINQLDSLSALKRLFAEVPSDGGGHVFRVSTDTPTAGDGVFGSVPSLLRNGNPWNGDASIIAKYYARQLFSLLRVTEMWSGVSMRDALQAQNATASPPRRTTLVDRGGATSTPLGGYQCVVYTRSDLLVGTPLSGHAIRVACGDGAGQRRSAKRSNHGPSHIVVPSFEHGGLNDRFAIGSPDAMLRYGARGLQLRRYVAQGHTPHAERFLGHFLCENNIAVHISNVALQRVRTNGGSPDKSPAAQTAGYRARLIPLWSAWLLQAAHNEREAIQRREQDKRLLGPNAASTKHREAGGEGLRCCAPASVMFEEP